MTSALTLARNLNLPLDAVTQTFGCIGRKGSGKTYLAGLLAEQMLNQHAQIIIIDPVGNWYGLRVAADGKAPGRDIFIVGGEHGDVPILPDAGARLARLLVDKPVSVILDISSFRQGERKRFAADFAEEFFHLKKSQKSAVHLFVEEAQLFAPQRCGPDEARMLGAFESIIRLGRNYGIGATMISQRPQSINKEVLSQVECLFVLQVNGTHERKALEEWVQEAGADRQLVGQLPGLAQGEGYVWSPSWLRIYARFHFHQKTTFDASATPKVGQKRKAATLTPMDVEALRADLALVIEKAEADDPKRLRAEIAALKRQLAEQRGSVETIDREALAAAQEAEVLRMVLEIRNQVKTRFQELIEGCRADLEECMDLLDEGSAWRAGEASIKPRTFYLNEQHEARRGPLSAKEQAILQAKRAGMKPLGGVQALGVAMGKAERSILTVLAQRGPSAKSTVAAYAGYAVNGGGFNNAVSKCRSNGWLKSEPADILYLTTQGQQALGTWENLPTGPALLAHWQNKVGKAERMILSVLADHPRTPITKEDLAHESEYTATGGGFNNALSRLRTLELIEGSGTIQLNKDFAEALRG